MRDDTRWPDPAPIELDDTERAMLAGEQGAAAELAMGLLVRFASVAGADRFVPISGAHIDSCLYHGEASLDFAERLVSLNARVRVPTTLNVGAVDLLHPELFRGDASTAARARRLMELYVEMGCEPTFTCAPYQLPRRPSLGEHIAWAESNAIAFANSVLGARTHRYGDFIDILAAIAGRAPYAGLHRPENRRGTVRYVLDALPPVLLDEDVLYPVLGHVVGESAGAGVPVIEGLPAGLAEDRIKALAAAAASSGAVAMLHVVGTTPEARSADDAFGGAAPDRTIRVDLAMLRRARDQLTTREAGPLAAVSLGTPHFSIDEFTRLVSLLRDGPPAVVPFYVSTARSTLSELQRRGWTATLESAGVTLVVDTCTYITPILEHTDGVVMTNSAKWAYYAPANLGVGVVFGGLEECVRSSRQGTIVRDGALWGVEPSTASQPPADRAPGGPDAERVRDPAGEAPPVHPDARRPQGLEAAGSAAGTEGGFPHRVQPLLPGAAVARALVLDEPISFWGGIDAATGRIIEARHPQHGAIVTGRVLIMPGGRGSSSSASVLAEMIRVGTAPAAIVLREPDSILAIGGMIGELLYDSVLPIVALDVSDRDMPIQGDTRIMVEADRLLIDR